MTITIPNWKCRLFLVWWRSKVKCVPGWKMNHICETLLPPCVVCFIVERSTMGKSLLGEARSYFVLINGGETSCPESNHLCSGHVTVPWPLVRWEEMKANERKGKKKRWWKPPTPDVNNLSSGSRWDVSPTPLVYFITAERLEQSECRGGVGLQEGGEDVSFSGTEAGRMEMGERD